MDQADAEIQIPLSGLYETDGGDITNLLDASSTKPVLEAVNGDTDQAVRAKWESSNSDAVLGQAFLPENLARGDVEIKILAAMEGDTDTPAIACDAFFDVGDTKVEDDSAAVEGTDMAEYTITIDGVDVPAGAKVLTFELTPGAHTTDALYVYGIKVVAMRG
jgi:hypothetical protein